jgi:hypothetical protein
MLPMQALNKIQWHEELQILIITPNNNNVFNPIPYVPFPLARRRGGNLKEGLVPLFNVCIIPSRLDKW